MFACRIAVFVVASVGLTGCGGTSTPDLSRGQMLARFNSLDQTFGNDEFTNPASIPRVGGETYRGIVRIFAGIDTEMTGQAIVTTHFARTSNAVTGAMDGFIDNEDRRFAGALTLSDGTINRSALPGWTSTFRAGLAGELDGAGPGGRYNFDGTFSADLLGDGSAMTGIVSGTFISVGRGPDLDINGSQLLAERDE
jgi:hypothetical protein